MMTFEIRMPKGWVTAHESPEVAQNLIQEPDAFENHEISENRAYEILSNRICRTTRPG